MKDVPRSAQFDDIYFSVENGLEETDYVFLKGNDLPRAWENQDNFVIAETGFGTGLNFLSAWKLFEETAKPYQSLDFISVEKYPLSSNEIHKALQRWDEYFGGRIDILCDGYPLRMEGFHRVKISPQVTLTLIFDDVEAGYEQLDAQVDCWFLDGFTPSKNPQMWSDKVFHEMARLSHSDTGFATFTAAGIVKRGLEQAGFSVEKVKGYGHKREMLKGRYTKDVKKKITKFLKNIAVIGGGLAGTSCAYVLRQYGFNPVIYEASENLANGASGNREGLYNPRFSKRRDPLSNFFVPAYAQFIKTMQKAENVNYNPCGTLHLMTSNDKAERYRGLVKNWGWHEDHASIVSAEAASKIAGVEMNSEALYLPDAGSVSPEKLCHYYACDIEVKFNQKITDYESLDADAVILATGPAVINYEGLKWLPLDAVRGQVSVIKATSRTQKLKCHLSYGGYMSPADENGEHMIGATFEKWVEHTDILEKGHIYNIERLKENIPSFSNEDFQIKTGRAGMRACTNDRFPVVGAVPQESEVYVSTAFGSHGIVGSLMGAHFIADCLRNGPKCLPLKTIKELIPQRFLTRAQKKGRDLRKSMI